MDTGRVNPKCRLEDQGITGLGAVYYNLLEPALIEEALKRGEGTLGQGGALAGHHRQAHRPLAQGQVHRPHARRRGHASGGTTTRRWRPSISTLLHADMLAHMKGRDYFVQDLFAGADAAHRLDVRVINELAWHGLFIRHMLRRPARRSWTISHPSSPSSTAPASRPTRRATAAAARP